MENNEQHESKITYRPATPADAEIASRLIFDTFPLLSAYIFGLGDKDQAKDILARIFVLEDHRFSYQVTEMVMQDEEIVGMFIAYPAQELPRLDRGLLKVIIKQHSLLDKIRMLVRGLPAIFIEEAKPNDFLLSNIAIAKAKRGQGIGGQVLAYVEEKARTAGYNRLALIVEMDKDNACRFYETQGFEVRAKLPEPPHRVKHLGSGFQQMVKDLYDTPEEKPN